MENNKENPSIDMNRVNKENGMYLSWVQSFSKKVVTVFSILYVIVIIVMICMLGYEIRTGYTEGFSTMIVEINETFRIVIGGYLIKAAVENGFKITGAFMSNINKIKLDALMHHQDEFSSEDFDQCEDNNEDEPIG